MSLEVKVVIAIILNSIQALIVTCGGGPNQYILEILLSEAITDSLI